MDKKYIDLTLWDFSEELGAKKTMPGGGSAAAYVATLSNDLASMVSNFTLGKKKYAKFEGDIQKILIKSGDLKKTVIELVDKDAEEFLPLAAAYKMPEQTETQIYEKEIEMQRCLKNATMVPIKVLRFSLDILSLHEELLEKGSLMLVSDVGVGVQLLKAGVLSAKLNVLINLKEIKDKDFVGKYSKETDEIVEEISEKCDRIYKGVVSKLK